MQWSPPVYRGGHVHHPLCVTCHMTDFRIYPVKFSLVSKLLLCSTVILLTALGTKTVLHILDAQRYQTFTSLGFAH